MAKGRSNYVCLRKLAEADQRHGAVRPAARSAIDELISLADAREWRAATAPSCRSWSTGGSGSTSWPPIAKIASARSAPTVHVHAAPDGAHRAATTRELIVANHALYFTDLVTGGGVLPQARRGRLR